MLLVDEHTLPQEDYIIKFGINGGLSVVRAISFAKIMDLSVEKLKMIFQPYTARTFRQFAMETFVNGQINDEHKDMIMDLADLSDLSMTISSFQFKDKLLAEHRIKEFRRKIKLRRSQSEYFLTVLLDMFQKNEIQVSITHPIQFGTYFNTSKDDSLLTLVTQVKRRYDLFEKVRLISMPAPKNEKIGYFVNSIFPSMVRALNICQNDGRKLRGIREVVKHIRDIKANTYFDYTVEEQVLLTELLEKVLKDARNSRAS